MTNTATNIMRYVTVMPDGHWIWNGPTTCPKPRGARSGFLWVIRRPRPEIHLHGRSTSPQRIFWESLTGSPPNGQLRRICEHDMCVNPACFSLRRRIQPMDESCLELLDSLEAHMARGEPFDPEKYAAFTEELQTICEHRKDVEQWLSSSKIV